jgi:hypothetical protein
MEQLNVQRRCGGARASLASQPPESICAQRGQQHARRQQAHGNGGPMESNRPGRADAGVVDRSPPPRVATLRAPASRSSRAGTGPSQKRGL